ncbi:MAG: segregation/condensation protein A, partial [Fibrobacteraceae bacterium]
MMTTDVQESYEVHIGAFEGPLDLLLYLVQKNEVAPKDISISEITDQYLAWIKDLSKADLSAAGDFLLMASRLMALKVRELLPKEEQSPEDLLEQDFEHDELIRQMMEYARYKQVAKELQEKETVNFGAFYRGRLEKTQSDDDTLADANVWQLFRAFQKSLKSRGHETVHHVELDYVTIEDRQQFISNYLARNGRALFEDLLGDDPHPMLAVVT